MPTLLSKESFTPVAPRFHHAPQKIAEDTWVIRQLQGEAEAPLAVYINSMVILGKEPVIVDTGTTANQKQWFEDVRSLVDPKDVRWIYISHDDADHTGNLNEILEVAPNATLISSWFQLERLSCEMNFPFHRMRWINDGETFDVGDRTLAAIRPPVYDSPTTRGLYDPKTRVYWASDTFAAPVQQPTDDVADLDPKAWRDGFMMFHSLVSPWLEIADPAKFNATVDRIDKLDIEVASGAHTPMLRRAHIEQGIKMLRELPGAKAAPVPGQAELEKMLAAMQ